MLALRHHERCSQPELLIHPPRAAFYIRVLPPTRKSVAKKRKKTSKVTGGCLIRIYRRLRWLCSWSWTGKGRQEELGAEVSSLLPCSQTSALGSFWGAVSSPRMAGLKAQAGVVLPALTPGEDSKAEGSFPAPLLERWAGSKSSCPAWERFSWGSPTSWWLPCRAACRMQVPLGVPSPVGAEARCGSVLRASGACTAPDGAAHLGAPMRGGSSRCAFSPPSWGILEPPHACTAPSRPA